MHTKTNNEAQVEYFTNKDKYAKFNLAEGKPVPYISLENSEILEIIFRRNRKNTKAIVITCPFEHVELIRALLHETSRINN